jgi:hypothetical protein
MGMKQPTWEDIHFAITTTGALSAAGSIFILLSIAALPSVRRKHALTARAATSQSLVPHIVKQPLFASAIEILKVHQRTATGALRKQWLTTCWDWWHRQLRRFSFKLVISISLGNIFRAIDIPSQRESRRAFITFV